MENRLRLLPAIKPHSATHEKNTKQGQHQKRNHAKNAEEPILSIRCHMKPARPLYQRDAILIPGLIVHLPIFPDHFHPSSIDRLIQVSFQASELEGSFPRHRHKLGKPFPPVIEQAKYFFEIERSRLVLHHANQFGFQESFVPLDQSVTPRKETT